MSEQHGSDSDYEAGSPGDNSNPLVGGMPQLIQTPLTDPRVAHILNAEQSSATVHVPHRVSFEDLEPQPGPSRAPPLSQHPSMHSPDSTWAEQMEWIRSQSAGQHMHSGDDRLARQDRSRRLTIAPQQRQQRREETKLRKALLARCTAPSAAERSRIQICPSIEKSCTFRTPKQLRRQVKSSSTRREPASFTPIPSPISQGVIPPPLVQFVDAYNRSNLREPPPTLFPPQHPFLFDTRNPYPFSSHTLLPWMYANPQTMLTPSPEAIFSSASQSLLTHNPQFPPPPMQEITPIPISRLLTPQLPRSLDPIPPNLPTTDDQLPTPLDLSTQVSRRRVIPNIPSQPTEYPQQSAGSARRSTPRTHTVSSFRMLNPIPLQDYFSTEEINRPPTESEIQLRRLFDQQRPMSIEFVPEHQQYQTWPINFGEEDLCAAEMAVNPDTTDLMQDIWALTNSLDRNEPVAGPSTAANPPRSSLSTPYLPQGDDASPE